MKFIEDDFLGGQRLDPKTDGRPDPRPDVRESQPALGDLQQAFDFDQTPHSPVILQPSPSAFPTFQCTAPGAASIRCGGRLTSSGTPVPGGEVVIDYSPPVQGSPVVHTLATAADGTFTDTLSPPRGLINLGALAPGNWQATAQYPGTTENGSASASQTVFVP